MKSELNIAYILHGKCLIITRLTVIFFYIILKYICYTYNNIIVLKN